jgi:hypothetical protein
MSATPSDSNGLPTIQSDRLGYAGDDRPRDHVGPLPLGKGGSYRTVQRFFAQALPWATLIWVFFRHPLYRSDNVYLLAGDEVVVTKAGKITYGLDRFFSSLYGKLVPGLAFFTLSLVSVQERRSFPLRVERQEGAKASEGQSE